MERLKKYLLPMICVAFFGEIYLYIRISLKKINSSCWKPGKMTEVQIRVSTMVMMKIRSSIRCLRKILKGLRRILKYQ